MTLRCLLLNGSSGVASGRELRASAQAGDVCVITAQQSEAGYTTGLIVDLALDADAVAACIFDSVPATKTDAIVRALNQRLAAVETFDEFDLRLLQRR